LVVRDRPGNAFASVLLTVFLLVTFASLGSLLLEHGPESNIRSAEDAIWWSMTTITTVGYGDHFPTTIQGRMLAMGVMLCGVGLFGTLSGLVSSWLVGSNRRESVQLADLRQQMLEIQERLDRVLEAQKESMH
jgi:voltage-gated potassium channel